MPESADAPGLNDKSVFGRKKVAAGDGSRGTRDSRKAFFFLRTTREEECRPLRTRLYRGRSGFGRFYHGHITHRHTHTPSRARALTKTGTLERAQRQEKKIKPFLHRTIAGPCFFVLYLRFASCPFFVSVTGCVPSPQRLLHFYGWRAHTAAELRPASSLVRVTIRATWRRRILRFFLHFELSVVCSAHLGWRVGGGSDVEGVVYNTLRWWRRRRFRTGRCQRRRRRRRRGNGPALWLLRRLTLVTRLGRHLG